jgi:5-(carboxyamino)imidazole ribonucleotide synthase
VPPSLAVLGGGQLGRMLGLAAIPLGIEVRFLDPKPDACAGAVGPLVVGALDDPAAIDEVAAGAAAVTYEWEGVDAGAARHAARHAPVRPGARALEVAQDRVTEKETFRALGIPTARFRPVDDGAGAEAAADALGVPMVLKTRRGGYDGKGQTVVHDAAASADAFYALGGVPCIAEALVPFDRELSVIAVRGLDGETRVWPLSENAHEGGILRRSVAPAPGLGPGLQARAAGLATALLDGLDYAGVVAIELFDVGGELLANEMAPRVHNSGHWTIEGAATSQFENHVRAVCGLPLGETATTGNAVMVNCLGAVAEPATVLSVPGAHLHVYGKAPAPRRKVGHVTVVADDAATAAARASEVERAVRAAESAAFPAG